MKEELKTREDVFKLVSRFYTKVRAEPVLGPIFNESITDWDEHLEKLTDFWESNLFFKASYRGNPKLAHIKVDQENDHNIEAGHFGRWMNLWFETIDENFQGELANRAKNNARKMGSHLYLKIFEARSR
ncbi:group III truncated hemoglobin [Salegentibacter sp. HM20]